KVVSSSMVNSIRNGAGSLIARMMNAPTILYLSMATYLVNKIPTLDAKIRRILKQEYSWVGH
ncbi:hypothetical protein, partial [Leptolyngbya sp. FACHB-321]|uniref:hypothetical protein n=1 Tax=Leptolyngbya sp. FACHB-321 TaxID=2692807 RepID=UPI001A7EB14D